MLKVTSTVGTAVFRGLGETAATAVMAGGVRSMVTTKSATTEVSPAAPIAVAWMLCTPAERFSTALKDWPLTVASGSAVPAVASKRWTIRPVSSTWPEKVTEPVSVRPSVWELPLSGEIARCVGAAKTRLPRFTVPVNPLATVNSSGYEPAAPAGR